MNRIEDIDRNLRIETKIGKENVIFRNVRDIPFRIYGVFFENGKFRRLPEAVAKTVNEGVYALHANTSGGRVRFKTDSPYVALHAKMSGIGKMPHFPLTGSAGFDMYINEGEGEKFYGTFVPPYDILEGYESVLELGTVREREITVNFPLYSEVRELYIGLEATASVGAPTEYIAGKPIVYYGSSITQGGCASRAGNAYPSIVARRINRDFINLGFSGSARGEWEIAQYIAGLDMSVFVYDYDHNAPNVEHLEKTHEKMFGIIREKNPELPIIMMTSVSLPRFMGDAGRRKRIIYDTYLNAKSSGDGNVYFLDGSKFFDECGDGVTVEGCHPNDLGFHYMAKVVNNAIDMLNLL